MPQGITDGPFHAKHGCYAYAVLTAPHVVPIVAARSPKIATDRRASISVNPSDLLVILIVFPRIICFCRRSEVKRLRG